MLDDYPITKTYRWTSLGYNTITCCHYKPLRMINHRDVNAVVLGAGSRSWRCSWTKRAGNVSFGACCPDKGENKLDSIGFCSNLWVEIKFARIDEPAAVIDLDENFVKLISIRAGDRST